jgi:hypothetical protein
MQQRRHPNFNWSETYHAGRECLVTLLLTPTRCAVISSSRQQSAAPRSILGNHLVKRLQALTRASLRPSLNDSAVRAAHVHRHLAKLHRTIEHNDWEIHHRHNADTAQKRSRLCNSDPEPSITTTFVILPAIVFMLHD